MKIIEMIPLLKYRAGAEVFSVNLAVSLKQLGHDVTFISFYDDVDESFLKQLDEHNIPLIRCGKKTGIDFKCSKTLKKIIKDINPDIIHMHLGCSLTYYLAFGAKKQRWKLVQTIHNVADKECNKLNLIVRKKLIKKNNLSLIGISPLVDKSIHDVYSINSKVIFNGIPLKEMDSKKKEYDLICVARFTPQKNHVLLIEVLKELKKIKEDIKLLCLGDGPLLEETKDLVKQYDLTNNVTFLGRKEDVYPYLAVSKIFVLSSIYEGNPISILEAMSSGLPIVAPDVGGVSDVVKDNINGKLFPVSNAEKMLEAIKQILDDENKYSSISKNNVEAIKQYSIDNCAKEHISFFSYLMDTNRICLIGNYSKGKDVFDGQRQKVRLYHRKLLEEGFIVDLVDLADFKRHPLKTLRAIKKGQKNNDVIVLITADRGANLLTPFINRINKNNHKRFVLPLIGISILHKTLDRLDIQRQNDFLLNGDYSNLKPNKKLLKELNKIDLIMPETAFISNTYQRFYGLNNVVTLTNFRDEEVTYNLDNKIDLVYVSRVATIKGIFDLIKAIDMLNKDGININLDIYGALQLDENENELFKNELNSHSDIKYCGTIKPTKVAQTISKYKLFIFPTKYFAEGTPGVLIESLIGGTPVISTKFPQAPSILKQGEDSIFVEMGNIRELADTIKNIYFDDNKIKQLTSGAIKNGKQYLYSYNRDLFLNCITGKKDK